MRGSHSLMLAREVARLVDGIASGTPGASAAIAQRLKDSEAALARLKAQPVAPNKVAEQLLPDLAKRCRSVLQNLEQTIMIDPHRAQFEMRQYLGRSGSQRRRPRSGCIHSGVIWRTRCCAPPGVKLMR